METTNSAAAEYAAKLEAAQREIEEMRKKPIKKKNGGHMSAEKRIAGMNPTGTTSIDTLVEDEMQKIDPDDQGARELKVRPYEENLQMIFNEITEKGVLGHTDPEKALALMCDIKSFDLNKSGIKKSELMESEGLKKAIAAEMKDYLSKLDAETQMFNTSVSAGGSKDVAVEEGEQAVASHAETLRQNIEDLVVERIEALKLEKAMNKKPHVLN